jgi:hypothetical protein
MSAHPGKAAFPIDRAPVEELAEQFAAVVHLHYRTRPQSRATVYEVLNALAGMTAVVIKGTGEEAEASAWFERALQQNLSEGSA